MELEYITSKRQEHVLVIGLNRPEKYNAVNVKMLEELSFAYGELGGDSELRVGVLHGHGDHFCAGLDLAEVWPTLVDKGPAILAGGGRYDPLGVWGDPVPKPVVMAVHGIAFTLAIELALASDIVVAADDVRFCQLEVGRGILPFGGATFRAPARVGWGNAMRFLLTAEEFGAKDAHRIGLVQEVVPVGTHVDRALELAQRIATQAPVGVQESLVNARLARAEQERVAVEHLRHVLPKIVESEDAKEGLQSFLERRPARFGGDIPR
jgi:enoyl-CoA hydratase/carnithine racemase